MRWATVTPAPTAAGTHLVLYKNSPFVHSENSIAYKQLLDIAREVSQLYHTGAWSAVLEPIGGPLGARWGLLEPAGAWSHLG
jgi:hypothetical protein